MINNEERVLAYQLATELSSDDLSKISGGGAAQLHMTTFMTPGGTGGNGGWEVHFDVTADF